VEKIKTFLAVTNPIGIFLAILAVPSVIIASAGKGIVVFSIETLENLLDTLRN